MAMLTVLCPQCGHWNPTTLVNCENCSINMAWALENLRDYPQAENKQSGTSYNIPKRGNNIQGAESIPSPFKLLAIPIILLFPLFLIFIFLIPYLDKTSIRPCTITLVVVIAGIWIAWAFLMSAARPNKAVMAAWSDLARLTGLTLSINKNALALSGKYRGRFVSMALESIQMSETSVEVYTKTSIQVENRGQLSLDVGFNDRKILGVRLESGDKEFDKHYSVRALPPAFGVHALALILPHKRLLLDYPKAAVMRTSFIGWTNYTRPAIKLDNSELTCHQLRVLTRADEQKVYLDLLCDIADLAEELSRDIPSASVSLP